MVKHRPSVYVCVCMGTEQAHENASSGRLKLTLLVASWRRQIQFDSLVLAALFGACFGLVRTSLGLKLGLRRATFKNDQQEISHVAGANRARYMRS